MNSESKNLKDALAALGIPRRAISVRTHRTLMLTVGRVSDPEHHRIIAEAAERLVKAGTLAAVVTRYPCGCVVEAIVTTELGRLGRVTTRTLSYTFGHQCPSDQ